MASSGPPLRGVVVTLGVLVAVALGYATLRDRPAAEPEAPAAPKTAARPGGPAPRPNVRPPPPRPQTAEPATPAEPDEPELDLSKPPDSPPPSFAGRSDEVEWYRARLATARRELSAQLAARERMPKLREKAEQAVHPEVNLAEWEAAYDRLERNIERPRYKIRWYQAKLAEMGEEVD